MVAFEQGDHWNYNRSEEELEVACSAVTIFARDKSDKGRISVPEWLLQTDFEEAMTNEYDKVIFNGKTVFKC